MEMIIKIAVYLLVVLFVAILCFALYGDGR